MRNAKAGKIDVLHVIGSFAAGGAERFVIDLSCVLKQKDISIGIAALSSRMDHVGREMCNKLASQGVPFSYGPTDRVRIPSIYWYIRELKRIRPGIVHLHTPNTELAHYMARYSYRVPHNMYRTIHSTQAHPRMLYRVAMRRNAPCFSIACSNTVRKNFCSRIGDRITVIHNAVSFGWPVPTKAQKRESRCRLGLSEGSRHFVSVGRQDGDSIGEAPKAFDTLIRAWKLSGATSRGSLLHLVGDGSLRRELEECADGDRGIRFHGTRTNIGDWLMASDCFVLASRYEGLPIAGIEAAGTCLPCIFTEIEPFKEIGAPKVLWSKVDDIVQLASNIIKVHEQDIYVPDEECLRYRERFSMENTAEKYIRCYAEGIG